MINIYDRLEQLLKERGWTKYKLSKESGLGESTISNMFARNTIPSLSTLEAVCEGFNISIAEFFSEGRLVEMDDEQQELLQSWAALTEDEKSAVMHTIKTFIAKK